MSAGRLRRSGAAAVVLGVVLAGGGATEALAADQTAPAPRCELAEAHLQLGIEAGDQGGSRLQVSGFPGSGCDGASAVLVVSGNAAGDPRAAATETLGTYDSRLDPCSQLPVGPAVVVGGGSIDFAACAVGGPARNLDLHDATFFTIRLVAAPAASGIGSGPSGDATPPTGSGSPDRWAVLVAATGVGLVAAGFAQRRRSARRAAATS